jgi:hypothetical protein
MSDLQRRFDRMAEWQASRKNLTWAEKVRMVEAVRESMVRFARAESRPQGDGERKKPR